MSSVLFICTGNQYRSPIAAAYLKRLLRDRGLLGWSVGSAGTWTVADQPPTPDSVRDAAALGLGLQGHTTRLVSEALLRQYDLVLVMGSGHKEALRVEFPAVADRVHLLADMLDMVPFDIPDPLALPGEHERVLRDMCDVIERGLPRILELASSQPERRL